MRVEGFAKKLIPASNPAPILGPSPPGTDTETISPSVPDGRRRRSAAGRVKIPPLFEGRPGAVCTCPGRFHQISAPGGLGPHTCPLPWRGRPAVRACVPLPRRSGIPRPVRIFATAERHCRERTGLSFRPRAEFPPRERKAVSAEWPGGRSHRPPAPPIDWRSSIPTRCRFNRMQAGWRSIFAGTMSAWRRLSPPCLPHPCSASRAPPGRSGRMARALK